MDRNEEKPKRFLISAEQFAQFNPKGWVTKPIENIPFYGQKIRIIDSKDFLKSDMFRLHELNCVLTIIQADPILIGEKDLCYYGYLVYTEEFPNVVVKSWNFEFVAEDKLL